MKTKKCLRDLWQKLLSKSDLTKVDLTTHSAGLPGNKLSSWFVSQFESGNVPTRSAAGANT